ncbi:MAG TPA: hypothetical protein EYP36_02610 [Calditrichaeota bacterium]|nr:hypothetical protein [Calditrichota bacterium]
MGIRQGVEMKKEAGHVAVEWVMITFILVIALFAPAFGENQSIMGLFMDSVRDFHENSSLLYSLP